MAPCTYCQREMDPTGTPSLLERTADHVIPQCRGGALGETVPACWYCNNLKGSKSPESWANFMRDNPHWWEKPEFARVRRTPLLTAAQTVAFLRRSGIEAGIKRIQRGVPPVLKRAQRCTNQFLPIGYTLTDPASGEALAILGEDGKFIAIEIPPN